MISSVNSVIIGRLPNHQAIVMKEQNPNVLSKKDEETIAQLKKRDNEVRQHEANHIGNPELITVNGPRYSYAIGPDGKAYAVGGNVTVSTGSAKFPEDAIRKAQALKNSAAGVSEMSPQDLGTALSAEAMIQEAFANRVHNNHTNSDSQNAGKIAISSNSYYSSMENLFRNNPSDMKGHVDIYA